MSARVEEVVQGSCRLPCLTVTAGARESVHENSPGGPTERSSTLRFITAIPLNVYKGSGCFVGIQTLAQGLRESGVDIELSAPGVQFYPFTARRLLFNETLRQTKSGGAVDATVGFDLDGYRLAGKGRVPHIAAIKGVLGDAVRFEKGYTRASMALQARLEMLHARRADRVITISRYCAGRIGELYGVRNAVVVPELIDLAAWRKRLAENPAPTDNGRFTVLCVCRFYRRKRVDVLLRAAAMLASRLPELEVRIVGGGPERARLHELAGKLDLERTVHWAGDIGADELAREYNRADTFCLPSVQEGFGIVFLEAMAAGKPIVAAKAAAIPEVVEEGLLVEPENNEALAEAIYAVYADSELRKRLGAAGKTVVRKYEMKTVSAQFLRACL